MGCLDCLCCCILVVTNIVAMVIGFLVAVIGVFLTFGFSMFSALLESPITSIGATLTSSLKNNLNVNLDIYGLLKNIGTMFGSMGAAFLAIGIIIIVLACLGCCGACCKSSDSCRKCLLIYAGVVLLIFLAQVIIVIIWFANVNLFKQAAKTAMEESLKEYTGMDSKNLQSLLQNIIQILIGCCGVNNGTDFYTISTKWDKTYTMSSSAYNYTFNLTYPVTCCKFNTTSYQLENLYCPYNTTNTNTSNYETGCYDKLFTTVEESFKFNTIFYILAGILGYQALLFVGAIIIFRANNDSNKVKPR